MKYTLFILLFAIAANSKAQTDSIGNAGFKNGNGGLLYRIIESKGGQTLKDGDFLSINVIAKTELIQFYLALTTLGILH